LLPIKINLKKFLKSQSIIIQNKIFKIIEAVETLEMIPANYFKHISGIKGLYEIRILLGSNIWRVFCFFDKGRIVILLNGFCKNTDKTPKQEIQKAIVLMNAYKNEQLNQYQ
jgi:phage-related protein